MPTIWQTNGGLYVGYEAGATEGDPPSLRNPLRYSDGRHMVTIGPSGSGKTKRLLVPALAETTGWSVIVNDFKGELCAMTEGHRRRAGSNIIKLNPFDVLGLGSDGFNPIAALQLTKEFSDDALELAEAVIRIEGKEPHWAQAAQEWVAAIIMYVRLVIPLLDGTQRTLADLAVRTEPFWVYSVGPDLNLVPGRAVCVKTRENAQLVRVTVSGGDEIVCTPDHEFMLPDGTYRRADKLEFNMSLMPLYRKWQSRDGYRGCSAAREKRQRRGG